MTGCELFHFFFLIYRLGSQQRRDGLLRRWQPKLASKNALVSRDPFLESPEKLFYVCSVYLQYQSFNNFENDTMKVSVNELGTVLLFNKF